MRKGTLVWWSLADDATTTGELLKAAGFEREIPRNEAKTALLKACKVVKKGWELRDEDIGARLDTPKTLKKADHRRFADGVAEVRVALTKPKIAEDGTFSTVTAMTINLTKGMASLTFDRGEMDESEFESLCDKIRDEFKKATETVDSTQLRLLVSRYVVGKHGCNAVSMRPFSGGVYFVPETYRDRIDRVKKLFEQNTLKMRLDTIPVYDDGDTNASIEYAVVTSMEKELKGFIDTLREETKKGISRRALESRINAAEDLKTKIAAYEEHMRAKADELAKRTSKLIGLLEVRFNDAKTKTVEPFDLVTALADLGD